MIIKKIAIFILISFLFSAPLTSSINTDNNDSIQFKGESHPPIIIDGNGDFTSENGVTDGNGTENNPYLIENWMIVNDSSTEDGIFIKNTNAYFTIRNCTIYNFTDKYENGIRLEYVENGRIENTNLFKTQDAIRIRYSSHIDIINCASDDYSSVWFSSGVKAYTTSYINISSCDFHGKGFGIWLDKSGHSIIDNSTIYDNYFCGIECMGKESKFITIKDCEIFDNQGWGIALDATNEFGIHTSYNHILRCELYNNGYVPGTDAGYPVIGIWNLHENIIEDCKIHHNCEGIFIDASRGNIIRNCTIFGQYHESGFLAQGISITNDFRGILRKGNNCIINCDIYDNELGIVTYRCINLEIEKNNIINNSYAGVGAWTTYSNYIQNNNICDNGYVEPNVDVGGCTINYGYLNARNNWWGSEKGPSTRLLPNRGDVIYRGLAWVAFYPWAKEPIPDAGVR